MDKIVHHNVCMCVFTYVYAYLHCVYVCQMFIVCLLPFEVMRYHTCYKLRVCMRMYMDIHVYILICMCYHGCWSCWLVSSLSARPAGLHLLARGVVVRGAVHVVVGIHLERLVGDHLGVVCVQLLYIA